MVFLWYFQTIDINLCETNKKKILQAKNTPKVTYLNGCETNWNCHWLNLKIHHTNGREKKLEHLKYIISSMSAFTSPTLQRSSALLLRPEADLIWVLWSGFHSLFAQMNSPHYGLCSVQPRLPIGLVCSAQPATYPVLHTSHMPSIPFMNCSMLQ